jgi:aldose sugar dehydrogenase
VKRLVAILVLSSLFACNDSTQPPISRYEPNVLGTLEVQVDSAGTSSALFKPRATLLETAVTFTSKAFSVTDSSGIRFFNATFEVKNNTATDFKNLSVVMYNKSAENLDGTAIKEVKTSSGIAITDTAVLNRIKPAHAMSTATSIESARADFQAFTPSQAAQIQLDARALGSISGTDQVLEYGFVARNGTARGIAAGATGTITLAFRVPKIDAASQPSRFVVTAVIFDIPTTTVVTRSREESASSVAARASAITDRSNPTEVVLIGGDSETSSCANCTFTRQANTKVSSSGKTLLDAPSTVGFDVETVKTGLGVPWSLNFASDGNLYFTERGAPGIKVSVKKLDPSTGNITTITDSGNSSIRQDGEGGVLGMELDPNFNSNNQVYICYSYFLNNLASNSNRRNRVSRFTISGANLTAEDVMFDDMLGWSNHNGCRVANGADGKLYFSIGDAADFAPGPIKAQDPSLLAGKIFRINYDKSIPSDNPYFNTLTGSARALWTFGHRNPQGLAFQPGTGALWSSEHGQNTRDELNLIVKGKNYGWPSCVGTQALNSPLNVTQDGTTYNCAATTNLTASNYQPAVKEYESNVTLATSDIAFMTSPLFPEWKGNILMNTLKANRMYRIELSGNTVSSDQILINTGYGRLRDVTISPDGLIYFSSDDGAIYRMVPK